MREYKILNIDAWAGSCGDCLACKKSKSGEVPEKLPGCWEWNNWYTAGIYYESEYGPLDRNAAMRCFSDKFGVELHVLEARCEIDDDACNLVLVDRRTLEPYYAIEYGVE